MWLITCCTRVRYLCCFTAFTLTSLLCGLANSAGSLIFFRVLQGAAGGLLAAMSQMMMAHVAGRNVPRVMGIAVMPVMIGPILGPAVAGAILQHASWRWIFFINLPVGLVSVTLAWRVLPGDIHERNPRKFDLPGFLLLLPALAMLLNSLNRLSTDTSQTSSSEIELQAALVLLGAFLWYGMRRGASALIDLRLFRNWTFTASALTQFLLNCLTFSGQMLFPLYLLMVEGKSPGGAGILLASSGIGLLCAYPTLGNLVERFGPRRISSSGTIIALLATLPFALPNASQSSNTVFCLLLFVRGIGIGCIGIPSISAAYASVPRERLAIATTAINVVQRLGGPTATTLLAIYLHSRLNMPQLNLSHAFSGTFRLLCILHALAILSALCLPEWISTHQKPVGSDSR